MVLVAESGCVELARTLLAQAWRDASRHLPPVQPSRVRGRPHEPGSNRDRRRHVLAARAFLQGADRPADLQFWCAVAEVDTQDITDRACRLWPAVEVQFVRHRPKWRYYVLRQRRLCGKDRHEQGQGRLAVAV